MYEGILYDLVFVGVALFIIAAALGVVISKNIVHSALFLVLTFLGVAAIYFQLNSAFIGIIQILVYAGAITILIIFAVMLVMDKAPSKTNLPVPSPKKRMLGAYVIMLFTVFMGGAVLYTEWPQVIAETRPSEIKLIANLFLGDYVVAFEVAAILLLVAVIGAIMLAKGAEDK